MEHLDTFLSRHAPFDALVLGIPSATPYLPRERPNPLLAAYLGLGLGLRLWRDAFPIVDGGTAILVGRFDRHFAHPTQQPYRAFFHAATPFPELATLNLASRPVSRAARAELPGLEDMRAIPWVFSWTQARVNLPGWYGLGSALAFEIEAGGLERLQTMYREWPFFTSAVDNAQVSLGTADLATARRYALLVDDVQVRGVFQTIEAEYERAVDGVLEVTRQSELLEGSPVLARSIKLRNPYVDALHIAQLALLRRFRAAKAADDELLDAIHHSINGIAAGLQTTG